MKWIRQENSQFIGYFHQNKILRDAKRWETW